MHRKTTVDSLNPQQLRHIYDLSSISEWLDSNPTSPFTRVPMKAGMLRPDPGVRAFIEAVVQTWPDTEVPKACVESVFLAPRDESSPWVCAGIL